MMVKIKTRAIVYAMGLVILLITIFTYTIIQNKNSVLEEKTQAHRQLLKNAFDLSLSDTYAGLNTLAYQFASDRGIVDAFAARDREALYRLALPYFEAARKEGNVDHTGFIGADGFHFLRVQDPTRYGDTLVAKRPILAEAIRTRKPLSSIDVTVYDVSVVTIIPIFKERQFIGIVQTVARIDRVQKRLNAHSGIKSAIAFDTRRLNAVIPNASHIRYQGFSIVSSNDPLFGRLPNDFTFGQSRRYTISDRSYVIASRPLQNYRHETVAMMTCAFDITDEMVQYRNEIRTLLFISFLMLLALALILHYGFKILLRKIDKDAETTKELNRKLEQQLYSDHLTSLPNRHALIRDMEIEHFYALMLINIDNFKEINDFYGHAVGDRILLKLANSISEMILSLPLRLYKMPSDEYALVVTEAMNLTKLDAVRKSIIHHLEENHYDFDGASIYLSLTVGMDVAPKTPRTAPFALLINADMALKSAKKRHLSYLLYDETMQIKQEYQHNILWSKKVKEAVEEKRFIMYYQPIFDHSDGSIIEYEALIRMVDKDASIISPAYFLPAAKQSRLYPAISRFVISEVFGMLKRTPHRYSINLSVDDIIDLPTREFIIENLRSASSEASRIIFELLESEGIENYHEVSKFITDVKGFGCQVAIDDFGTGYSNFAHIIKLDVDILKIDGSLIRNIDTDANAQTILTAVSEFSKHLGLKTVAEFVHNEAVYNKCREMGIDYMQGYYLAEPKPL